jgi:hypothetical protein
MRKLNKNNLIDEFSNLEYEIETLVKELKDNDKDD